MAGHFRRNEKLGKAKGGQKRMKQIGSVERRKRRSWLLQVQD
jgi:translation elongation factor EF-4